MIPDLSFLSKMALGSNFSLYDWGDGVTVIPEPAKVGDSYLSSHVMAIEYKKGDFVTYRVFRLKEIDPEAIVRQLNEEIQMFKISLGLNQHVTKVVS